MQNYNQCSLFFYQKQTTLIVIFDVCVLVLSPNLRIGLKQNFMAKSGILGFLILLGRFLYEKKY